MKIKTIYSIGDMVAFTRDQKTLGGEKVDLPLEVGIIEKILYDGIQIAYLMRSSYQAWVKESEIKSKLERV